MEIVPVPAFTDNYIWLVHDAPSGETAVVDPGDAAPALAEAQRRGWTITQVWNTHHHWDHSGGNVAMKEATGRAKDKLHATEYRVLSDELRAPRDDAR